MPVVLGQHVRRVGLAALVDGVRHHEAVVPVVLASLQGGLQDARVLAEPLRHRVDLAAQLPVERERQAQVLVGERVGDAARPVGVVVAEHDLARIAHRQPARRVDDDVALTVAHPHRAHQVAVRLAGIGRDADAPVRAHDDALHAVVERQHLVRVLRPVQNHAPAQVGPLDRRQGRRQLDAAVAHLTGVHNGLAVARGLRDRDRQDLVRGGLLVQRGVQGHAVVEQPEIDADLLTRRLLRFEVGVRQPVGRGVAGLAGPRRQAGGVHGPKLVGIGVVADASPARTQLAIGNETALDAQRVREDESRADRGVKDGVVTGRKRRGPVVAAGHVHVEPVLVVEAGQAVERVDLLLLLVERVGRLAIRVL